jgi:ElaB/YqjD/DUF883 family membrane-anchored ribosome-binding protein
MIPPVLNLTWQRPQVNCDAALIWVSRVPQLSGISDEPTRGTPIPTCPHNGNHETIEADCPETNMKRSALARNVEPYNELLDSVEDLLKRIADVDSPEIKKIRAKVQVAAAVARSAWQDTANYTNRQVRNSLQWPNDYLRESPWRAVGIATAIGMGVGAYLITSARRQS